MKIYLTTNNLVLLLMVITGLAPALLFPFLDRSSFGELERLSSGQMSSSAGYTWSSRLLNGAIVIVLFMLAKRVTQERVFMTVAIRNFVVALIAYLITNYIFGGLFGLYKGIPNFYLVSVLVVLMFLPVIKGVSSQMLVSVFRFVAGFMVIGSLCMAVFMPGIAYMADVSYEFTSGGSSRLIGFFGHPTVLGLYALMLLAVELHLPKNDRITKVNLPVCFAVIVLTVSKSSMVLAATLCLWHLAKKGRVGVIVFMFVLVSAFGYLLLNPTLLSFLDANDNYMTLTGRVVLWEEIINSWLDNPLFGNGPAFFGSGKIDFAHAHNSILQSISDGGLLGLLGFLGYLAALLFLALKNTNASRSLSIVLVLLLLGFSMTDAVMRIDLFLSGVFFINATIVLYLCALDREKVGRMIGSLVAGNAQQGQSR